MALFYNDTREFSPEALEELFLSVQWESGNRLGRLEKALLHYGGSVLRLGWEQTGGRHG